MKLCKDFWPDASSVGIGLSSGALSRGLGWLFFNPESPLSHDATKAAFFVLGTGSALLATRGFVFDKNMSKSDKIQLATLSVASTLFGFFSPEIYSSVASSMASTPSDFSDAAKAGNPVKAGVDLLTAAAFPARNVLSKIQNARSGLRHG